MGTPGQFDAPRAGDSTRYYLDGTRGVMVPFAQKDSTAKSGDGFLYSDAGTRQQGSYYKQGADGSWSLVGAAPSSESARLIAGKDFTTGGWDYKPTVPSNYAVRRPRVTRATSQEAAVQQPSIQDAWSSWIAREREKAFNSVRANFADRGMLYSSAIADPLTDVANASAQAALDQAMQERGFGEGVRQFNVGSGQTQQQINNQASQFGQSLAEQRRQAMAGEGYNREALGAQIANQGVQNRLGWATLAGQIAGTQAAYNPSNASKFRFPTWQYLNKGMTSPQGDPPENEMYDWGYLAPKKGEGPVGDQVALRGIPGFGDDELRARSLAQQNADAQLAIQRMNAETARMSAEAGINSAKEADDSLLAWQQMAADAESNRVAGLNAPGTNMLPSQKLAQYESAFLPQLGYTTWKEALLSPDATRAEGIIRTMYSDPKIAQTVIDRLKGIEAAADPDSGAEAASAPPRSALSAWASDIPGAIGRSLAMTPPGALVGMTAGGLGTAAGTPEGRRVSPFSGVASWWDFITKR